ncbi:MAG: hypothetical protein A3G20_03565 [Acidobacteria bacterium RIFCSPLOWO2_12_FULL_59_11]|nr:MAG: hypothetical protein A3G20_03565 [Acidobacteria bacterium RIFCSPLOWO2_12_FULL_59_11]
MTRLGKTVLYCWVAFLTGRNLWGQSRPIPPGFLTGQAARFVLGQKNFSDISFCTPLSDDPLQCPYPTDSHLGAISGIAIAGNKLIVADSSYLHPPNNNRVLIYNDLNALKNQPPGSLVLPNVVLGQADFTSSASGTSASLMNQPVGVATDGVRLFVADWLNNRVLIYNQIPETNGAAANVVVGQQSFDTADFGAGSGRLRRPNSVSTDGTRLLIADTLNNRILVYNRIPTQNGAAADVVLGQPNFDGSKALPAAANTLQNPMSATTDGQRLIITDLGNSRVLIYNDINNIQSGAAADVVVGQPDFTSTSPGNTSTSLDFPRYAYSDGTRLLIVDSGNNRILIYNKIPTENGMAADLVLGQEDFLGLMEACAASNLTLPYAVASDGEMLFVSDSFSRRVLGFQPSPALVYQHGVVNAASFSTAAQTAACGVMLPQPPVAPGGLVSIFGTGLAGTDTPITADSLPRPTKLGGVQVKFNGIPAPLLYVSPTQINAQVPFELTGYSASVEVEKDTPTGPVVSAAVAAGVANGAPGIFTPSQTGDGPGMIFHTDYTPVTDESPAVPGETLIAFATGLGTVDQPVTTGATAQFGAMGSITLSGPAPVFVEQTITVTIGGVSHSYTPAIGESLDITVQNLANLINDGDPTVTATVNVADISIDLRARITGEAGVGVPYSASVSEGGNLTLTLGDSDQVPGSIVFQGTPEPGQTVTVNLGGTDYSYTTVSGDTPASVVNQLTNLINSDPSVAATADPANGVIHLELREGNADAIIPYTVSISSVAKLTASVEGKTNVPTTMHLAGTATPGQTVNINLGGTLYSYTTTAQDTLESVVTALTNLVNGDPNVSATADLANLKISLQLRNPDSGLTISVAASVSATPSFTATAAYQHLVTGVTNVINSVSAAIGSVLPLVPGDILFSGIPVPGQFVTVTLQDTPYSYTAAAGDTLQIVLNKLTDLINGDPNVSATVDLTNFKISLALRNTNSGLKITFSVSASPAADLLMLTRSTTDTVNVSVIFAGPLNGTVGLYQVVFALPDTIEPNPKAALWLKQNLIIFGSISEFDIFSNPVEFPIAAAQ